jgi:hypothetical protein
MNLFEIVADGATVLLFAMATLGPIIGAGNDR